MTTFTPSTWISQGQAVLAAADELYRQADPITISRYLGRNSASAIEAAAADGDENAQNGWHTSIAHSVEALSAIGSIMIGTGEDYSATEEAAASRRFWQ